MHALTLVSTLMCLVFRLSAKIAAFASRIFLAPCLVLCYALAKEFFNSALQCTGYQQGGGYRRVLHTLFYALIAFQ